MRGVLLSTLVVSAEADAQRTLVTCSETIVHARVVDTGFQVKLDRA